MTMLLNPADPLSEVLTMAEAAVIVGRDPATLRDWIRKGWLTPLRLPGSRRVWTTGRDVRETERMIWLGLTQTGG